jgi:hypothetical protein
MIGVHLWSYAAAVTRDTQKNGTAKVISLAT